MHTLHSESLELSSTSTSDARGALRPGAWLDSLPSPPGRVLSSRIAAAPGTIDPSPSSPPVSIQARQVGRLVGGSGKGGPFSPVDALYGPWAGCPLGRRARLWPVGCCGPAQGCVCGRRDAVVPCVGLKSIARVPWLGRAAQAARPTQGARRPRHTPHPAHAHAAARTQRPPCPPAPTPRAPGAQSAAFSRPRPLARPCPQV